MWIVSGVSDTGEKINLQSQRKVDIVLAIDDASVVEAAKEASDNQCTGALGIWDRKPNRSHILSRFGLDRGSYHT